MKRLRQRFGKDHRRAAAFVTAAAFMLVPANVLPILSTELPGQSRTDTIFSGIMGLIDDGSWGVAAIVFTASILVPLLKIVGVGLLLYGAQQRPTPHPRAMTRLYSVLDFIGRWSMLDVFLVAFLCGAVQFGSFARVRPQPGAIAFAAAVVLTMLATDAFDPRSLWQTNAETSKA